MGGFFLGLPQSVKENPTNTSNNRTHLIMQFSPSLPAAFFEPVTLHTLSHRGGKYNVETPDLYIINHEFHYRGAKAAFGPNRPPFYLLHEECFKGACQIFTEIYQHEPDLFAYFNDPDKTWNAFLVTSSRLYLGNEFVSEFDSFGVLPSQKDFRYFPVIGGFNSYNQGINPGFYYLIAPPFEQGKGSFLTLANFRFLRDEDKQRFLTDNRPEALRQTIRQISKEFVKAEYEFRSLLDRMAEGTITRDDLIPVILDLYDKNRNTESVANDTRLQGSLRYLAQAVEDFFPTRRQHLFAWTALIQFIIRNNEVNLNEGLRLDEVEELFSRKRAYTKFIRLFVKFLNDLPRYERYLQDQRKDWDAIRTLI